MSTNSGTNIRGFLKDFNVRSVTGWTDSTVIFHCLREKGNYKFFIANRVKKILEKELTEWKYALTKENPPDFGSRGCTISKLPQIWLKGPNWLCNISEWLEQPYISPTSDLVVTTIKKHNSLDRHLEKFELWKVLRISAWINRFVNICRKTKVRDLLRRPTEK